MSHNTNWPLTDFTNRQKKKYDEAWEIALTQAGGSVNKLATQLSAYTNNYITHQSIRNWRRSYNTPPAWALVIESYTKGKADFFDLIPWLLPRAQQLTPL